MEKSLAEILGAAKILNLPIEGEIRKPEKGESFWELVIGKGYPTPRTDFRWCTDRLKLKPTKNYVLEKVAENGKAIILTGVRKDESANRKNTIEKYKNLENSNLTPHTSLKGAFVFRPIVDVKTAELWEFIYQNNPPWGGSHKRLIELYQDALGLQFSNADETEEAPDYGTNGARFGCWCCTVITKDRSLQGLIDTGKYDYLKPLLEFREFLADIRNKPEYRQLRRRSGNIEFKNGSHIAGPFTIEGRHKILEELLKIQKEVQALNPNLVLISKEEIERCRQMWKQDVLDSIERDKQIS